MNEALVHTKHYESVHAPSSSASVKAPRSVMRIIWNSCLCCYTANKRLNQDSVGREYIKMIKIKRSGHAQGCTG